jgi:hypothetical protein
MLLRLSVSSMKSAKHHVTVVTQWLKGIRVHTSSLWQVAEHLVKILMFLTLEKKAIISLITIISLKKRRP